MLKKLFDALSTAAAFVLNIASYYPKTITLAALAAIIGLALRGAVTNELALALVFTLFSAAFIGLAQGQDLERRNNLMLMGAILGLGAFGFEVLTVFNDSWWAKNGTFAGSFLTVIAGYKIGEIMAERVATEQERERQKKQPRGNTVFQTPAGDYVPNIPKRTTRNHPPIELRPS